MAHVLNDRVYETTETTGIGTVDLAGAVAGYQGFVAGIGDGNSTDYVIEDPATGDWEVGRGTVTDASPDTLSRTTVHSSSNAGAKVNFAAGPKNVFCSMPAAKLVTVDNAPEIIDDRAAALIQNGTALAWSYNDGAGTLTGNVQLGTGSTQAAAGNHDHSGVYVPIPYWEYPGFLRMINASTFSWVAYGTTSGTVAEGNHNHSGVYQPAGTYYAPGGTDVALADGGTGASLSDPNADRILFWDDSAGSVAWLAASSPLSISGTNLQVSVGTGATDVAQGNHAHAGVYSPVGHDHSGVYQPAGSYYSAGGTDVALADGGTGSSLSDPNADRMMFWDDSSGATNWLGCGNSLAITVETIDTIQDIRTSASPQFAGVNVGHASDTTITRASAGVIAVEGKNVYMAGGTDVALADGGTGASLTDPNADRILFWDDSAGAVTWLTAGTGLSITDTSIACGITQYTDEMAQDACASMIQNGTGITWSYNDASNTLTPTVTITQYTDALARAAISTTVTGLTYTSATGVLSLTAGYVIPTTTAQTNWNTAYGWGNHASAGYAAGGHNHSGTYEPVIAAGTTAQYWRGDKSWQTLNQAAVAGLTTADTPTFQGMTAAKTVAGSVTTTIQAQVTNSSSGETHTSKFACQDNNTGTIRALFACAGPLNSGDDNQGYFDLVVEDSTMYIGRWKSLAADNGTVMQLYTRATPQVITVTLHTAGVSYIDTGYAFVIGGTATADSALFYVDGKISTSGELEVNGALNHDGTTVGFYGVAPASRPSAYTQTYSTADRTHANSTYAAPSGGTTVDSQARTSLGQLAADVVDVKQLLNAIIDDLQSLGLLQ